MTVVEASVDTRFHPFLTPEQAAHHIGALEDLAGMIALHYGGVFSRCRINPRVPGICRTNEGISIRRNRSGLLIYHPWGSHQVQSICRLADLSEHHITIGEATDLDTPVLAVRGRELPSPTWVMRINDVKNDSALFDSWDAISRGRLL